MQFKAFERKATRIAGQVAQKGSELLDAGKTKLAIGKEEHAIDELYYKMGEAIFQQSEAGGEVPAYLASDIAEIKEHLLRIESLKNGKKDTPAASASSVEDEVIIDITAEPEAKDEE
ncbi:MAG: hypothetical protein IIY02_04970 [Firmicutes bacterium]|nr:hypothetical protein [Bacillota bacterium]